MALAQTDAIEAMAVATDRAFTAGRLRDDRRVEPDAET